MSDPDWSKFKYTPTGPHSTRYHCDRCGHDWKPRAPKPGDNIYCPKCGEFHSHRAGFKVPPMPRVMIHPGKPVEPKRSKPIKPYKKRGYVVRGLDRFKDKGEDQE